MDFRPESILFLIVSSIYFVVFFFFFFFVMPFLLPEMSAISQDEDLRYFEENLRDLFCFSAFFFVLVALLGFVFC